MQSHPEWITKDKSRKVRHVSHWPLVRPLVLCVILTRTSADSIGVVEVTVGLQKPVKLNFRQGVPVEDVGSEELVVIVRVYVPTLHRNQDKPYYSHHHKYFILSNGIKEFYTYDGRTGWQLFYI